MAILEIKNLTFGYKSSDTKALNDVSFEIEKGDFAVICGESGCGKTTLLRLLKKQLAPFGDKSGSALYKGTEIAEMDERTSVSAIGFVMQDPNSQIVTDKVWHELAFGLESLGENTSSIRRKVAEISEFFGITEWYNRKTSDLSGGQKQILNLASIMVMQPEILLLDEPTSQLDPIAASEFISTLKKLNNELGITVILAEHRLEEVFPIANKVIVMDNGKILNAGTPREVGKALKSSDSRMYLGMPSAIKIYNMLNSSAECPLTVRECKDFIKNNYNEDIKELQLPKTDYTGREAAFEIKDGYFRYEKNLPDVLKGLNLTVYKKEFLCILGGNGAGKTTLLKILSGIKRLYSGKLRIWGKKLKEYNNNTLYRNNIASLPQNPKLLFVKNNVYDDLTETANAFGYDKKDTAEAVENIASKLEIKHLYKRHPYDLSGGEVQKAAFAKILLAKPKIILLDEPTKGLDAYSKTVLADMLKKLINEDITVVTVTHDIEFAAEYADRCALLFDGQIVSCGTPEEFFSENNFYTTAAARISKNIFINAVTNEEVANLCRQNGVKNAK